MNVMRTAMILTMDFLRIAAMFIAITTFHHVDATPSSSNPILFFNTVVNLTSYANNVSLFSSSLTAAVNATPSTLMVVNSYSVTYQELVALDSVCLTSFQPIANATNSTTNATSGTANTTNGILRLNLTFVGPVSDAANSCSALNNLTLVRACALGLLTLTSAPSTASNTPVTILVTLLPGTTIDAFIANLAALLQVPTSVFVVTSTRTNATVTSRTFVEQATSGETFTITIVGANPSVVQGRMLNLTSTQLAAIGASALTPASVSEAAASSSTLAIIIGCSVGGGVILIVIGVLLRCCCCAAPRASLKDDDDGGLELHAREAQYSPTRVILSKSRETPTTEDPSETA